MLFRHYYNYLQNVCLDHDSHFVVFDYFLNFRYMIAKEREDTVENEERYRVHQLIILFK